MIKKPSTINFFEFLILKRNTLIILMCINCFAWGVNILGIRGEYRFTPKECSKKIERNFFSHYLFCSENGDSYIEEEYESNFWPFVDYFEDDRDSFLCSFDGISEFKGLFRYFDKSEFIFYSVLIFLMLYFRWEFLPGAKYISEKEKSNEWLKFKKKLDAKFDAILESKVVNWIGIIFIWCYSALFFVGVFLLLDWLFSFTSSFPFIKFD